MGPWKRSLPYVVVVSVSGLSVVLACSGATTQDVLQSTSSSSSSGGTSGSSGTSGTSGTSGSSGASGTSGSSGTSGTSGTSGSSGSACPAELEPNNESGQANQLQVVPCTFSTCQNGGGPPSSGTCHATCGEISSSSDVDFLAFTLQPSTTKMQVKFDGKVTLQIAVDGMMVTLGAGGNQSVPFVQDKPYSVAVRALEMKNTPNWAVCLVEQ